MNGKFGGCIVRAMLGVSLGLTFASIASAADYTMKIAGGEPNVGPMNALVAEFQKCIGPASGSRIGVRLFPGTQLGGPAAQAQGAQNGTIEAVVFAPQHLKGVDKTYGVVDAPGLFQSFEHANATYWDPSFHDRYLQAGKDKGVLGISIIAYGPTSFQSVKPLRTLADFKGKKFRILATDIERKLTEALSAAGLQVEWPDLIPAMQRSQIDGMHSNITLAASYKFYTVSKYTTMTNLSMVPVGIFVSTKFYDKLPADLQKSVLECGREAEKAAAPVSVKFDEKAMADWKAGGGELVRLGDKDQAQLNALAVEVGDSVYLKDPDLKNLYEIMKAAAAKHAK